MGQSRNASENLTQDQELHVPGLVLLLSFEAANTNEDWVIHLTSHKKFIVLFSPFHFDQLLHQDFSELSHNRCDKLQPLMTVLM